MRVLCLWCTCILVSFIKCHVVVVVVAAAFAIAVALDGSRRKSWIQLKCRRPHNYTDKIDALKARSLWIILFRVFHLIEMKIVTMHQCRLA